MKADDGSGWQGQPIEPTVPQEGTVPPPGEGTMGVTMADDTEARVDLAERLDKWASRVQWSSPRPVDEGELEGPYLSVDESDEFFADLREAASKLRSSPPEREGTRVHNGKVEGDEWPALVCAVRSKRHGIQLTVPFHSSQRLWQLGYEVREYVPREPASPTSREQEGTRVDWEVRNEGVDGKPPYAIERGTGPDLEVFVTGVENYDDAYRIRAALNRPAPTQED